MNSRPDPTAFLAITPSLRSRLETAIEHLLALLDELDGDPDLEEGGDHEADSELEPNIGWTGVGRGTIGLDLNRYDRDGELEQDDAELGIADHDALHTIYL